MRYTTMNMILRQFAIHSILLEHVHRGTHINVQGLDDLHRKKVRQVRQVKWQGGGDSSVSRCVSGQRGGKHRGQTPGGRGG
jgi:hypothetical protein